MSAVQLFHVIRRHLRTFLVVFVVAFAAGVVTTLTLPESYRATATLIIGENRPLATGATSVQLDEVLTRTYAALLETSAVEQDVRRALPYQLPGGALENKVSFEVVSATRLIRISALDPDPRRAQQLADAYAATFVRRQQESAVDARREQLDRLSQRIGALAFQLRRLDGQNTQEAIEERARVEAELAAARDNYATTRSNAALQGTNVAVASRATVPASPATPRTKLYIVLAAFLALLLAGLAVLLRRLLDDSVEQESDVTGIFNAPLLARLPRGGERRMREALDVLRAVLLLQDGQDAPRVVAVTGAEPGAGKSTVAVLLADAFARAGETVVLVDADLRRPVLAARLGVDSTQGLTTVLVEGRRTPIRLVRGTRTPGVSLLPAGPLPPSPSVLLGLPLFEQTLAELSRDFDRVVVDTSPSVAGADAMLAAAASGAALVVADVRRSRRRQLATLRDELAESGARVLGVVLNRMGGDFAYGYEPDDVTLTELPARSRTSA